MTTERWKQRICSKQSPTYVFPRLILLDNIGVKKPVVSSCGWNEMLFLMVLIATDVICVEKEYFSEFLYYWDVPHPFLLILFDVYFGCTT